MIRLGIFFCLACAAMAQDTVSPLIREDAFAAFQSNDMNRLARVEKTIARLLKESPKSRPTLLAWEASTKAYRAVRAYEQGKLQDFGRLYAEALLLFADAEEARGNAPDISVASITGTTYIIFADRVPEQYRKSAWGAAYRAYQFMWKMKSAQVKKLSPHARGELLAGIAMTAQRTGRGFESAQYLDRMTFLLPGTLYATAAKKWLQDPASSTNVQLACLTCHR
jgi:hypothetical protein